MNVHTAPAHSGKPIVFAIKSVALQAQQTLSGTVPPGLYVGQLFYLKIEQTYMSAFFLYLLTWGFITQKDFQVLCGRVGRWYSAFLAVVYEDSTWVWVPLVPA